MKHQICFLAFVAAIAGSLILPPVFAGTYSGGLGTADDPFRIGTTADWEELAENSIDWSQHFILTADIDLAEISVTPLRSFSGVLDGQNHCISNIFIDRPFENRVGLIAELTASGQLRNLYLTNAEIQGRQEIGSLVGSNQGTLLNCHSAGDISGSTYVGGLVGRNDWGTIKDCVSDSITNGGSYIGGLVGLTSGTISSCYCTGTVSGIEYVGGLSGSSYQCTITNSYVSSEVSGDSYVGGLVGENVYGTIVACFATDSVIGYGHIIGGLCGGNIGLIMGCYSTGTVIGGYEVGGLVGDNFWSLISQSYATGDVNGEKYIGGLCGFNDCGTISECSATGAVSGTSDVGGLCGYNYGDEFTTAIINGCYASGSVVGYDRFIGGLCGGNALGSIVDCHSTGSVTGGDYTLCLGGLCGGNPSGVIRNCFSTGEVSANASSELGGLCGYNESGIHGCYSTGSVNGGYSSSYLGGLCGINRDEGGITDCYTKATVTGGEKAQYIGGLCGYNECGIIRNCYATGTVNGGEDSSHLGGLFGGDDGSMISGCFWDIEICETDSCCGTGLPTIEMKTLSTFTDATWDFVGESTNGTADIWRMCSNGMDYPRLSWEFSQGGDFDCPDGVALDDLLYLASRWLASSPETAGTADMTGNGTVNLEDFSVFAEQWPKENRLPEDLVIISAGTFQMGNSTNAEEGNSNELPVHTVTLDSFAMGKFEVTNEQYCAFLNSTYPSRLRVVDGIIHAINDVENSFPYCNTSASDSRSQIALTDNTFSVQTKAGRDISKDPMVCVSWYGSVAYCNWRSQEESREMCYDLSTWTCDITKNGYRLPTEAEWEYAARGGIPNNRFPWGDTISHSWANYYSYWSEGKPYYPYDLNPTQGWHHAWIDGIEPYTSPVGSFPATGYGLFDMAGNVVEWCNDWYLGSYYGSSPQTNPTGPETGSCPVLRGGCWSSKTNYCRVSSRGNNDPVDRDNAIGFRIVLNFE